MIVRKMQIFHRGGYLPPLCEVLDLREGRALLDGSANTGNPESWDPEIDDSENWN